MARKARDAKVSMFRPHERVGISFGDKDSSRTRQEFAAECDINTIMARYNKTGVINHFSKRTPSYVDFADAPDFQTAMNVMEDAKAAFMTLPAVVRRQFENDPAEFVKFASDAKNLDQMREWGLAAPAKPDASPVKVEVVKAPEAPAAAPAAS